MAKKMKAARQPHRPATQTVRGGVSAEPRRENAWVKPCAKPRSVAGTQNVIARVAVGNAPASPIPKKNRATQKPVAVLAAIINAVSADQYSANVPSIRLGPNRSPR